MCGIAGFSRNTERSSIPNGRRFAVALAEGIESRGRDATGFTWQERDDAANVWYSKQQGPASKVANRLALPGKGITNLLAHTRFLTLGGAENNDNNHPVVADHITCTHNGRVENHDELIEMTGLDRIGEVDSWSIPALLSQQAELGAAHPKELLELIHGVAAIAWLDASDPGVLHLARMSTRPLTIGWTKRGDLVYSSTRGTLEKGYKRGGVGVTDIIDIPEGTYLRVRDGAFEEWSEFKVNPPKAKAPDNDMPGLRPYTNMFPATTTAKPKAGKGKRGKKGKRKNPRHPAGLRLPNMSGVGDFDPDTVEPPYVMDHAEYLDMMGKSDEEILDNLDRLQDFDSWEQNIADSDGIDWDSIIPRRGHADYKG